MITRCGYAAVVEADSDAVWQLFSNFGSVAWHPMVATSTLEDGARPTEVGAVRMLQIVGGGTARERLLAYDEPGRTSTYGFLEPPPIPAASSAITLAVRDAGEGRSPMTWSAEFGVADAQTEAAVIGAREEAVWPSAAESLRSALPVREGT